ncbi:MAG TPA: periplasmic heavy metal sensor [Vicinamibacterales bacterium]|nr:periplasmic heavy metal sensor [Vicinamibacterales bacterium]
MTTRFKTSRLRRGFGAQALAAGVMALSLAGAAYAQEASQPRRPGPGMGDRMRGPRGGFGPGLGFLDLTDDQRAQMRKIREARQNEFKAAGEKLRAAREGMRQLIESDTINEAAIRSKAAEVAAAEAEVAILNARVRQESLQVLTSEQQQELKEFREQRGAQVKQRRGPRAQ